MMSTLCLCLLNELDSPTCLHRHKNKEVGGRSEKEREGGLFPFGILEVETITH